MERPLSAKLSSARLAASAFVAAFLIILFPFAESMILHYPDERHYSQGGVLMLETGDYLTPRTGEETVRLKKPPFAYWMSVAGMTIFGIGALGSRFFWLIAAFGVLTLTYRLALKVSGNERIALFSLAILGSNFVFLRASVNAIPDMPLTLFIMVALNGFAGLLFGERENRFDAWLAYLGTSFAILTKGIPALGPLGCALMLMVLFPSCRGRFRRFVVPLPALIGLAIAGSWFAYQVQLSPMAMYDQFIRDEVISKLEFSLGAVISSVGLSVTSLLLPLAGWLIVTAAAWLKTGKRPGLDVLGNSVRLFVGWIIVNIAFFAPAIKPDHRYIIPSIPALSVLTAAAIAHLSQPTATHYLGRFMKFLAIALGLVFAVLIIVTAQLISVPMLAIMGCGIAAGLIVLWRVATAAGYDGMVVTLAAVPMSVMLALYPVVSAFGMPDVGQPIAAEIRKLDLPADQIVVVDMDIVASEVRLHSGVTIPFKQVSDFEDILDAQSRPMSVYKAIITLDNKSADLLANLGYNVTIVIGGWRHVRVSTLIDAVLSGTLTEAKRNEGDKAYIAVRPE